MASIVTAAEWMEAGYKVRRSSWYSPYECIESKPLFNLISWCDLEPNPETLWMHFNLDDLLAMDWEIYMAPDWETFDE